MLPWQSLPRSDGNPPASYTVLFPVYAICRICTRYRLAPAGARHPRLRNAGSTEGGNRVSSGTHELTRVEPRASLLHGQRDAVLWHRQPFHEREPVVEWGDNREIDFQTDCMPVHGCWNSVGQLCRTRTLAVVGSNRQTGKSAPPARFVPRTIIKSIDMASTAPKPRLLRTLSRVSLQVVSAPDPMSRAAFTGSGMARTMQNAVVKRSSLSPCRCLRFARLP